MYRFPLEPVLNHQKHREDSIKQELSKREEALFSAKIEAERIKRLKDHYERVLREKERCGLEAAVARAYLSFVEHLSGEIGLQQENIRKMEAECSAIRIRLLEVMKKREMLESLEEKGQIAHDMNERREEQSFLNELAIGRFLRAS
jgi:flagellar export protein FliJ